jgi:hypothetical protein
VLAPKTENWPAMQAVQLLAVAEIEYLPAAQVAKLNEFAWPADTPNRPAKQAVQLTFVKSKFS